MKKLAGRRLFNDAGEAEECIGFALPCKLSEFIHAKSLFVWYIYRRETSTVDDSVSIEIYLCLSGE